MILYMGTLNLNYMWSPYLNIQGFRKNGVVKFKLDMFIKNWGCSLNDKAVLQRDGG